VAALCFRRAAGSEHDKMTTAGLGDDCVVLVLTLAEVTMMCLPAPISPWVRWSEVGMDKSDRGEVWEEPRERKNLEKTLSVSYSCEGMWRSWATTVAYADGRTRKWVRLIRFRYSRLCVVEEAALR